MVRDKKRLIPLLVAAFVGLGSGGRVAANAEPGAARVHQVTASAQGLSVNSYVVESEHGLVVIDSALTVSDARALRTRVDAMQKPLLAILLTHGHPDHYNGVYALNEGRSAAAPVYATAAVAAVIRDSDAAKEAQWKPVFGAEWPTIRSQPDREVGDAEVLTFDGLSFVAHVLGPGESHADSYWELRGHERAAFIGDAVLAASHAYTSDGHTQAWLHNLDLMRRALKGVKHIYPGHGPAGDLALLAWQKRYLHTYRGTVAALAHGGDRLSEKQKAELVWKMKAAYPGASNEFMIALGADSVAAELAHEPRSAR